LLADVSAQTQADKKSHLYTIWGGDRRGVQEEIARDEA